MLLSPTMELNRLESTTAVKIGVCRYPTRPVVGLLRVVRVTGIPAGRVGSGNKLLATGRVA